MRLVPLLAVALLVPLAGCFHAVVPAGVPADVLADKGYTVGDSRSESRAGFAKLEVRQYERTDLAAGGYASLMVVTITDVPVLTGRAVAAAADDALAKANAQPADPITLDFAAAGAGSVQAEGFTVEQDGQEGKGFRAEFTCTDGYVLVVGIGANLPLPTASNASMFENVQDLAKAVTCDGGSA